MSGAQVNHVLLLCLYVCGRGFTCLKHLGFSDSPFTRNGIFSGPPMFEHASTIFLVYSFAPIRAFIFERICFVWV
jgi:hypothetical protein